MFCGMSSNHELLSSVAGVRLPRPVAIRETRDSSAYEQNKGNPRNHSRKSYGNLATHGPSGRQPRNHSQRRRHLYFGYSGQFSKLLLCRFGITVMGNLLLPLRECYHYGIMRFAIDQHYEKIFITILGIFMLPF